MTKLKVNQYIELFNPSVNSYYPVRVLKEIEEGYLVKVLGNGREIKLYKYYFDEYGYSKLWITEKLLKKVGFNQEKLKFNLEDIVVYNVIVGELNRIENKEQYEFNSKGLGYAIFNKVEIETFLNEFKELSYRGENTEFKSKFNLTGDANNLFEYLIKMNEKYNYKYIDNLFLKEPNL